MALAEDPTYRQHVSFLLTGIADLLPALGADSFCTSADPDRRRRPMSESMQTLMKVLSQVGVYVGAAITFVLAYALFRYFAKEPRTLKAYFKLYCLAFGFIMPLYAVYEFVARGLLGGTGHVVVQRRHAPDGEQILSMPLDARSSVALALICGPTSSPSTGASGACRCGRRARSTSVAALASYQAELLAHVLRRLLVAMVLIARGRGDRLSARCAPHPRVQLQAATVARSASTVHGPVVAAGVRVLVEQRLELGARNGAEAHGVDGRA